jgi:surface carbohydrate biosynthesis protein
LTRIIDIIIKGLILSKNALRHWFYENWGVERRFHKRYVIKKRLLLTPVDNQACEFDLKVLLACVAAERGFSLEIGFRREMEFNIDGFPRSSYLSRSMTVRSPLFFRVANKFDHQIVTWDEKALVHLPPETYFSCRLDPSSIRYVSRLFAWGPDDAELWRQHAHLPNGIPIHM